MFTPLIRFTLLILCTIVAIIAALAGKMPIVVVATLCSISLLWGYYNVGTVYLALHKMRKAQYADSERILALTRKPEKLSKKRRAYYHYVAAYLAREKDDFKSAEHDFLIALDTGLSEEHDRAIALLALAEIEVIKGNKDKARTYLERMKGLRVKDSLLPQVRQMQQYLA